MSSNAPFCLIKVLTGSTSRAIKHPFGPAAEPLSQIRLNRNRTLSSLFQKAQFTMEASSKPAHDFITFVNDSPTPFHAVHELKKKFAKAGFEEIKEREDWSSVCKPGGKYYLTRNASTIFAFGIGKKWTPGGSIATIGTHVDSCALRIKPFSNNKSEGFLQVGVEGESKQPYILVP